MKHIESLKASTYNQAQAFFFSEMQKALGTKAEQLLQWLSFDPELLDLTSEELVYMYRLELPTFELISFAQQLEFANNAAADIIQQYSGIWVNIAYDEENGVLVVYLSSEDVSLEAIDNLFNLDEEEQPRRVATVAPLSLVPTVSEAPAPVEQPNAPSEPVAPASPAPVAADSQEEEEEPETFATEDEPNDVPDDEAFNEEMLTVEQIEAIDAMRKDEDAAAFIRANLETGVEQFDAFVEFNDVSDFPMSVVYRALELYEEFLHPQPKTETAAIFSEEEPDAFPVEEEPDAFPVEESVTNEAAPAAEPAPVEPEAEPVRVAPMGGERAPDAAIAEAAVTEADSHAIRFAQILQDIAKQLPDDSASEISDGVLVVLMTRTVPNESGVGSQDVDFNLRLTIRREMFAGVREIDKYRLENNGAILVETGSAQVVTDTINSL
jgi:hypothetical protein